MSIDLEIHPKAKKSFDIKSKKLISLVKEIAPPSPKPFLKENQPGFFITTISEKDIIGDIKENFCNHLGQEIGKTFRYENKKYGIIKEAYIELVKLSEIIQKTKPLINYLSFDYIKDILFEWIKKSFKLTRPRSFINYLMKQAAEAIQFYKILIPIPYTSTQHNFILGKISFESVSEKQIDEWFRYKSKLSNKNFIKYVTEFKKNYQGYAAGIFECYAEANRAQELAYSNVRKSLAILRLFSPANYIPDFVSGAYEYGKNMYRSKIYFKINKHNNLDKETNEALDSSLFWHINIDIINILNKNQHNYNKLLVNDNPNEFQNRLLEAIMIYSKNTLMRDIYDKLLYILVALESMLLKNDTEPIQQNIGDRMAFAIEKTPLGRKKISNIIKKIYSIRSKFIHHGKHTIENIGLIQIFMNHSWRFFSFLIQNVDNFKTKEQCIEALDRIKYS